MARATKTSKTIWWFWYVLMLMLRARAPTRQLSDVSKKHRSRLARQNMAEPRQPGFDSAHFSISYFGDLWWNNLCLRLLNRLNPFSAAFPGAPWIPWSKMIKMSEMRFWGSDCVRHWWSSRRLLPRWRTKDGAWGWGRHLGSRTLQLHSWLLSIAVSHWMIPRVLDVCLVGFSWRNCNLQYGHLLCDYLAPRARNISQPKVNRSCAPL